MNYLSYLAKSWVLSLVFILLPLLYSFFLAIYRLYLSPIAKFPGSKLAAATAWYEFYFDVLKPGMYIYEIKKMHDKFGPIVRVNPWELSIRDPDFYDELYVLGTVRKTDKYAKFCQGTGLDGSALLTHDHDLHRKRRRILDPFFSRSAIRKLEPLFASLLTRFETRLGAAKGTVIRLDHALTCLSGDIIRSITCGSVDLLMDDPEWSSSWFELFVTVVKSAPLMTSLPWLIYLALSLPTSWLLWFFPKGKAFQDFKTLARAHISQAKADSAHPDRRNSHSIFRKIVQLPNVPEVEKDTERLTNEAQALFGAATVAVGRTLETIAYYVLADECMKTRLAAELKDIMSKWPKEVPSLQDLEKLPFLQGVVNEALRVSYGSMHRMPRLSPDEPLVYKQWVIPPNVPVGMSAYFNHNDSSIFENPSSFLPDRWIGASNPRMKKALIPFTRGSRMCLGNNLAISEINMAVAMLFRPLGPASMMKLFQTNESDVKSLHDFMIPMPKLDTKGLRVLMQQ